MSKSHSRSKRSHKHDPPQKKKTPSRDMQNRMIKVAPFVVVAVLVAIPFGMGKYFEFNSPGAYDSGAYVYSAAHIVAGAEIGVEEKPSAQIGTLMVNMLGVSLFGYNETGPLLIQTILQAAALVLMFIAMRKLFGMVPAGLGVLLAAIYLSSPLIAKFGNVKEQYMIACMILGMSCFVLYQLGGKWFWAVLAGAFLIWAPLFKPTGTSAIGAIGIFVLAQPLLKHRTFKQTGIDILLLLGGAAGALAPLYIWILAWDVKLGLPYAFAWKTIAKMLPSAAASGAGATAGVDAVKPAAGYLERSRVLVPFSEQWPRVLRYYGLMILPITLAVSAILVRVVKMSCNCFVKSDEKTRATYDRFVLLFAIWWILDMAFVWISPRSYEQYYLPLNASAAMLGGYLAVIFVERLMQKTPALTTPRSMVWDIGIIVVWIALALYAVHKVFVDVVHPAVHKINPVLPEYYAQYEMIIKAGIIMVGLGLFGLIRDRLSNGMNKFRWGLLNLIGAACVIVMVLHIFSGVLISPHSGRNYANKDADKYGGKRRGYAQKLDNVRYRRKNNAKGSWERAGQYIREHSSPDDTMYVWGWFPGIYVVAERFSLTTPAFMMPRSAPSAFTKRINQMVDDFKKEPPKFIVDSRKRHIPMDRPPYELWPIAPAGFGGQRRSHFLRAGSEADSYDEKRAQGLRSRFDDDEADRYEAMKPLRDFIMNNYEPAEPQRFVETRGWQRLLHIRFGEHIIFRLKDSAPIMEQP